MQLPVKAHYAVTAALAMAERYAGGDLLTARAISQDQHIPSQFLGQILQQLRTAGLITSTRGSSGGFRLVRSPEAISVAEIVDAVCPTSNCGEFSEASRHARVVNEVWQELNQCQRDLMERVTLGHLVEQIVESPQAMFYI